MENSKARARTVCSVVLEQMHAAGQNGVYRSCPINTTPLYQHGSVQLHGNVHAAKCGHPKSILYSSLPKLY